MIRTLFRPIAVIGRKGIQIKKQKNISVLNINKHYLAAKKYQAKQESSGSLMIKNENLKFDSKDFQINMYPFHPQIVKKSGTSFQINKNSTVLALNFVQKTDKEASTPQKSKQNWQNRKSIAFRFNQLSKIIDIDVNNPQQSVVNVERLSKTNANNYKKLTFKKSKQSGYLDVTLGEEYQPVPGQFKKMWKIETRMEIAQFQMMQFLIKQSLFDLSGMKFMFDIRRNEQLAKINLKQKSQIDKEDLFKNYDNKDSIV